MCKLNFVHYSAIPQIADATAFLLCITSTIPTSGNTINGYFHRSCISSDFVYITDTNG